MEVNAPDRRTYSVRRRWLPWRQRVPLDTELVVTLLAAVDLVLRIVLAPVAILLRATRVLPWEIEVRDTGARKGAAVVMREQVRGWGRSAARMRELGRELEQQHTAPDAPGWPVVMTRDPVSMGDDTVDNTRVLTLDDRTAEPTLATLLTALQHSGRFISISGAPTTWVLRESSIRRRSGRPLAVFVLDPGHPRMDLHPVADTSFRVARDAKFHLEYLLTQSLERTLELIAADPSGRRTLREDRMRLLGFEVPPPAQG